MSSIAIRPVYWTVRRELWENRSIYLAPAIVGGLEIAAILISSLRSGEHFLFLGCRFKNQLERTFARQIMKRSSDLHWAVLPGELTRNEQRFLEEQNIQRLDMPLESFVGALIAESDGARQAA